MSLLHRLHDWWHPTISIPKRPSPEMQLRPAGGVTAVVETNRGVRIAILGSIPALVIADWLAWVDELPEVQP